MHKAVRNVTRMLERIQDYEKRVIERRGALSREDHRALLDALGLLARVLAPISPHIAEALLLSLGFDDDADLVAEWPGAPIPSAIHGGRA